MKRPINRSRPHPNRGRSVAIASAVLLAAALAGAYFARKFGERSQAAQAAAPDSQAGPPPLLLLEEPVLHGRIVEVRGRTWPNATVMVNSQSVPAIFPDGRFRFFTPALPTGSHTITVTAQTAAGETKTVRSTVVLQ